MNITLPVTQAAADPGLISASLAQFAGGMTPSAIPHAVRERAKHLILNAVGIAYASGQYDFAHKALTGFLSLDGSGPVPVIGMPARLPSRDAAVMNGLLINGLDYDDTHQRSVMHATASVLSTVLSVGYTHHSSGAATLAAYVAGVEAAIRLGNVAGSEFPVLGFHPTSVLGIFGCTLAAGNLMGLGQTSLVMAQGIALSMSSGNLECHEEGAWSKRLHPGWAAQSGITAAALARHGFTGPRRPYEGRFGVYNAFIQKHNVSPEALTQATAGLWESWETEAIAVKPMPACHWAHACSDAAVALREQYDFAVDDIVSIRALVPAGVVKAVCEPVDRKRRPENAYAAQFSVPFIVAASLLNGRFTLSELEPAALSDKTILALCDKVDYEIDSETTFPVHFSGEVRILLKDGRLLVHREAINRGCADRPLSNDEIVGKFMENAQLSLSTPHAERVLGAILWLDNADDVAPVMDTISGAVLH